jgi:soluble lytic murein transglycosylase-like protein
MRQISVCLVALFLALISVIWMNKKVDATGNRNDEKSTQTVSMSVFKNYNDLLAKLNSVKVEESRQVEEKLKRPNYPDIPLSDSTLDYLWSKSQETNFAYSYLLALAKTESEFNPKEKSSTHDHGLYQIHKPTDKFIAKELGLEQYNLYDPITNIDFAVFYLSYLRDYWRAQGVSEEEVFDLVTISYNRGIEGCKRYLQHHSTEDNTYLRAVLKNKNTLEKSVM